ncbi:MAG: hypothetical protein HOV97_34365 [Nonomuraea sp.]|nr:hypothetical protein [Nonomuraea sp.]
MDALRVRVDVPEVPASSVFLASGTYALIHGAVGRRMAVLGAGPSLPIRRLTRETLAARLRTIPLYREGSARLGRLLRVEAGVKYAVDLIERC